MKVAEVVPTTAITIINTVKITKTMEEATCIAREIISFKKSDNRAINSLATSMANLSFSMIVRVLMEVVVRASNQEVGAASLTCTPVVAARPAGTQVVTEQMAGDPVETRTIRKR